MQSMESFYHLRRNLWRSVVQPSHHSTNAQLASYVCQWMSNISTKRLFLYGSVLHTQFWGLPSWSITFTICLQPFVLKLFPYVWVQPLLYLFLTGFRNCCSFAWQNSALGSNGWDLSSLSQCKVISELHINKKALQNTFQWLWMVRRLSCGHTALLQAFLSQASFLNKAVHRTDPPPFY